MFQSSLLPGLLFHSCSSAHACRLPVRKRMVSRAESQYDRRTSTSTPSTSKTRICGSKDNVFGPRVGFFARADRLDGMNPRQLLGCALLPGDTESVAARAPTVNSDS